MHQTAAKAAHVQQQHCRSHAVMMTLSKSKCRFSARCVGVRLALNICTMCCCNTRDILQCDFDKLPRAIGLMSLYETLT